MKKQTRRTVSMPGELHLRLQQHAMASATTASGIATALIREYLDRHEAPIVTRAEWLRRLEERRVKRENERRRMDDALWSELGRFPW